MNEVLTATSQVSHTQGSGSVLDQIGYFSFFLQISFTLFRFLKNNSFSSVRQGLVWFLVRLPSLVKSDDKIIYM